VFAFAVTADRGEPVARNAFAAVMLALAVVFFLLGQSIQHGGRLILSQSFYLLAGVFGSCFVISVLPGRHRSD